jgi:hypothetical protein
MKFQLKSMGSLLSACALAATLMMFCATANASPIVEGDAVLDPTTNLQWLDASVTENMTPDQALAANPGYQLATWSQVMGLLEDNGIPASVLPGTLYSPSNFLTLSAPLLAFYNYSIFSSGPPAPPPLGSTYETPGNVLDASGNGADLVQFEIENALFQKGILVNDLQFNNNLGNGGGGDFDYLVQATPIPTSLLLFASGLLGLFALRCRRIMA